MSDDVLNSIIDGNNSGGEGSTSVARNARMTDDLNAIFDLLGVEQRRYVLYHLHSMEGKVTTIEDTVDAVYAYEAAGTEEDELTSQEQIRVNLHHAQLPWLADAGLIDYDRRHGTIHFTGFSPHQGLEEWLEHARQLELD